MKLTFNFSTKNHFKFNFCNLLLAILVLLTLNLQPTTQQELISKSNVIETHCILSFDPQGNYNCYLFNVRTNYSDVLNIVGSHLQNLTDADVHGVIFTNSMINQFKGEVFQKFINLKHLNLRGNFLQSISENAFESCEKLEELHIGSNPQLLDIPSKMLSNCGNLKTFTMTYGYFRALPDDLFGSASNLEVFNAANGRLTSIPDNFFHNMTKLRIFNIWNCPLRNINPRLFENVAKGSLEEINISGALLSDQQEVMDLLDGHLRLKKLLISSSSLPMFNLSFFTQFDKLEELSFSGHGNHTKMDWHALPSSLKILNVFRIIKEIPENAFEKLTSLIHLYITGDGITNLQKDTLKPLSQLERLEIVSTNLSTLHPELFTSQLNLGYLRLDYNEIEELPEGIFAPLINLGLEGEYAGLYIVRNKLKSLSANIFGQHPYLKRIDFSYNQINKIERGIFSRIHPIPEYANFFQNECINWYFRDEDNLDQRKQLELCFNNYDGILTTTPGGAERNFGKFEVLFVILVAFVKVLMEYWQ